MSIVQVDGPDALSTSVSELASIHEGLEAITQAAQGMFTIRSMEVVLEIDDLNIRAKCHAHSDWMLSLWRTPAKPVVDA